MRILEVNTICGHQSTGRIVSDLKEALEARGDDCVVAYGEKASSRIDGNYHIGTEVDRYLHAVKVRLFDQCGFGSSEPTKKFVDWIDTYQPDIIHLHNLHGYYINIRLLFHYIQRRQIKTVWTFHDCWPVTGHCTHFISIGCEKWKTGCEKCPLKKEYPSSYFLDRSRINYLEKKSLFTAIDNMTIVTPSKWLAEFIKESYLGRYNIEVIHNGIDTSVFKPSMTDFKRIHRIEDKKIVLGVASVWNKQKGIEDFCKLSKILNDDYVIVLVGLTEEQIKILPANIIGLRRTESAEELAKIYSAAEVFVNPTYEDNYPTVNLEAQACGTPVITYRTGGSVESVTNDCVIEVGDVEGIATKIISQTATLNRDLKPDRQVMIERYLRLFDLIGARS